jgi:hypothetical protein
MTLKILNQKEHLTLNDYISCQMNYLHNIYVIVQNSIEYNN